MSLNYNSIKVSYTSGDLFTLTGSNYTGYFNVLSGIPYVGKNTQTQTLEAKSTFGSDIYLSNLLFDRLITDEESLPYSLSEVLIQPNEFVTARVLNDIFTKLNYNNLYLYSQLLIQDNNIPANLTATLGITGDNQTSLNWFTTDVASITGFSRNATFSYLASAIDINASLFDNENKFTLFTCTSSHFYALTGDFNNKTVTQAYSSNLIRDDVNNVKTFNRITDFTVVGDNLFIIDSGALEIFRYDISELQSVNNYGRRIYVSSTGGNYSSNSVINTPQFVASDGEHLLIYDSDIHKFVLTDLDFNILKRSTVVGRQETTLKIGYNHYYKSYYIVAANNNSSNLYLYIYSSNLDRIDKIKLDESLLTSEVVNSINFSYNNSNVFYLVTNLRVIKKLVSKPTKSIGYFTSEAMSFARSSAGLNDSNVVGDFRGFDVVDSNNNYDIVVVLKESGILICQEPNTFASVLFNKNNSNYPAKDIGVHKHEYVQANYINVELYKVVKNILLVKEQLLGNFTTSFAFSSNNIETLAQGGAIGSPVFAGYNYLKNYNFLPIQNLNNLFLHENERVTPLAINRCISNIYELLLTMLKQSQPVASTLIQYPSANGVLYLS